MNEVTGRATKLLLELVERLGYDSASLVEGHDAVALRSGRGTFAWDVWVELVERVERDCGGVETLDRLGLMVNELPVPHEFKKVARLFWSAAIVSAQLALGSVVRLSMHKVRMHRCRRAHAAGDHVHPAGAAR